MEQQDLETDDRWRRGKNQVAAQISGMDNCLCHLPRQETEAEIQYTVGNQFLDGQNKLEMDILQMKDT